MGISCPKPIVGYNMQNIEGGKLYNVALQFEGIGKDGVARLDQVFSCTGVTAATYDTMTTGATIMFWNGSNYEYYYYINDAYDQNDNPVDGDVWTDAGGYTLTDADLRAIGDGFWLRIPSGGCTSGASITVAGQVSEASSADVDIAGSAAGALTLASNPFPTATDLSKVTTTGLTASTYDTMTSGATIMFWNGSSYDYYYYINDAYDANDNPVDGDVWTDAGGYTLTAPVADAGKSFWMRAYQNGTLTFTK